MLGITWESPQHQGRWYTGKRLAGMSSFPMWWVCLETKPAYRSPASLNLQEDVLTPPHDLKAEAHDGPSDADSPCGILHCALQLEMIRKNAETSRTDLRQVCMFVPAILYALRKSRYKTVVCSWISRQTFFMIVVGCMEHGRHSLS